MLAIWAGVFLGWWSFPSFWKEIIFFLFIITVIITNYLFKLRKKQPLAFAQFYLLSITLKIIAGLAFVFFLIWKAPGEVRANVGLFIISYMLFTGVEVIVFWSKTSTGKDS
jgi:hypothetical protein